MSIFKSTKSKKDWDVIIRPKSGLLDLNLHELWPYRDLLILLIRRDIVTVYKQTLLGFFWFILPPVLNSAIYIIIFGLFAKVEIGSSNIILFYFCGIITWSYFSDCIVRTSSTFRTNEHIFGKVYFPRLIVPMGSVLSALVKFGIQFVFFIGIILYFVLAGDSPHINWSLIWLLPLVLLLMAISGLAFGLIITSITSKYRDLSNIVPIAVQFLMYATPVIYPYTFFPQKYQWILDINPISPMIEIFRYVLLGSDRLSYMHLGYSIGFSIVILFIGLILFNKTERTFMDTV
jgi:lipopolysaccharide transport system permease protein